MDSCPLHGPLWEALRLDPLGCIKHNENNSNSILTFIWGSLLSQTLIVWSLQVLLGPLLEAARVTPLVPQEAQSHTTSQAELTLEP